MFVSLITVIHVFICLFLILIVLLQQGKGADAGATFGGGGNTFFGASGADNLLTRVTTFSAIAFMCTSIFLAISTKDSTLNEGDLINELPETAPIELPEPAAGPVEETVEETKQEATSEAAPEEAASTEAAPVENAPAENTAAAEAVAPAAAPAPAAEVPATEAAEEQKQEAAPQ